MVIRYIVIKSGSTKPTREVFFFSKKSGSEICILSSSRLDLRSQLGQIFPTVAHNFTIYIFYYRGGINTMADSDWGH